MPLPSFLLLQFVRSFARSFQPYRHTNSNKAGREERDNTFAWVSFVAACMAAAVKVWVHAVLPPDEPLCNSAWPMGILLLNARTHTREQNRTDRKHLPRIEKC